MTAVDTDNWLKAWTKLMGTATAFRRSCLLFAAVELGVFSAMVEDGASVEEIAVAIGGDTLSTRTLLNGLVAVELLHLEDDRYTVEKSVRPLLLDGPITMLPDIMRVARENEVWLHMGAILKGRSKPPIEYAREFLDSRIATFPALMWFNHLCAKAVLEAVAPRVQRACRVLDLGGGDGTFAEMVMTMNPTAMVTVLELEGGAERCIALAASDLAAGRLQIIYGDARHFQVTEAYHLIIINELLELFCADDKERILHCAAQALSTGGAIVLVKFSLEPSGTGPPSSAIFSMRMRLKAESYLESDEEVLKMLRHLGFTNVEVKNLGGLKAVIVATSGSVPTDFQCENTLQ